MSKAERTIKSLNGQIAEKVKEIERLKHENKRLSLFLGKERGENKEYVKKLKVEIGSLKNVIIAKEKKISIGDKLLRSLLVDRELSKEELKLIELYSKEN